MSSTLSQRSPRAARLRRLLAGGLATALATGLAATVAPASGAAAGTIYEAEDQVLTGVTAQTEHAGYSGTGFVGGFQGTGNSVRASVTATTAGPHDLVLRYANGNGGAPRTLTLDVNGTARQISLPDTGGWKSYGMAYAPITLQAGANTVEVRRQATDSGSINLDYLRAAPLVGVRHEAEAAALTGGANVQSDHAGYTGAGFVGGLTTTGATATFTVDTTTSGNHPATLRYAAGPNPFNGPKKVTLTVNGTSRPIILPGFSNWKTWSDLALDLPLNAGANQVAIRFAAGDDGNVNLDHLDVGQPAPPVCDPTVATDDTFDGTALDRCRWTSILNQDDTGYRVAEGALQIDARSGDLSGGVTNARNVVLQPARSASSWMTETAVSIDGSDDFLQAGLVVWGNAANFGKVMAIRTPSGAWNVELGRVTAGSLQFTRSATLPAGAQTDLRLRLWTTADVLRASYSLDDGATWTVVGAGYSTTGLANPLVGIGAFNGTGAETARFDSFTVGDPVLIASTVTLQAAPTTVQVGETSTVTVRVAAPGATPTGRVTLQDDGLDLGSAPLVDGAATFQVGPYSTAGTRTLTAAYAGDTAVTAGSGTGSLTVTAELRNQTLPTITGTAAVGSTLTAGPGTWNPSDATFAYQWLANGAVVAGATQPEFTPTAAEDGKLVSVRVTASRPGSVPASATSPTTRVTTTPIVNLTPPVITGPGSAGSTLQLSAGTWNHADVTLTYLWYLNGAAIRGASKPTLTVLGSYVGKTITGRVTAARPRSDSVAVGSSNSIVAN